VKAPLNFDPVLIRPLALAQNEFLQVLLSSFRVRRQRTGLVLEVEFGFDTPAVWLRKGKAHVQELLRCNVSQIAQYQKDLERILLHSDRRQYSHSDPTFPFRFGNGGTLPVIRCGGEDYYCLFYRDQDPVGWNIANGGAESVSELCDPHANIVRELREELIIVEPRQGRRYVFADDEGLLPDHPDFALARRIWEGVLHSRDRRLRGADFADLKELTLPLKWLPGPDSVLIHFDNRKPIRAEGLFLNINAEDFSIELDRVVKIEVSSEAVFCDGEIVRGYLLDRVVGLFRVDRLNAELAAGRSGFLPDRIFYRGQERPARNIRTVIEEYLSDLKRKRIFASDAFRHYQLAKERFALCPVTRTLIKRVLLHLGRRTQGERFPCSYRGACEVFVSFPSEDRLLAREVSRFLERAGRNVFFSDETLHQADFASAIDTALDQAKSMVVVGTEAARFHKPWVRYEWQSFHNDILSGRKPWNTPLLALVADVEPGRLPRPLSFRQVFTCDPARPTPTLRQLLALLS
jgi:hypothetical protein